MNRETYDAIAGQFSGTRSYLWDDLAFVEPYVEKGMTILDLGCGNGRVYQLAHKKQAEYIGIDQSEGLIALAREKSPEARFMVSEMTELPLESDSVDLMLAIASFHHLPSTEEREKCLREIHRVLKSDGRAIFLNWNLAGEFVQRKIAEGSYTTLNEQDVIIPWRDGTKKNYGDRYYHGFSESELNELFVKTGFTLEKQHYTKRGEQSDKENGDNLFSIVRK